MIWVIIPAFNEEKSIGLVLSDLPREVDEIVVIDNGSTDETAAEAKKGGATVLYEPRKGYGFACLAGIEHLKAKANQGDIVVFLDGDYSDYPEELTALITPILQQKALFVLGTRVTPQLEKGALTPQQRFPGFCVGVGQAGQQAGGDRAGQRVDSPRCGDPAGWPSSAS